MGCTMELLCLAPGSNKERFCTAKRPKSIGVSQLSVRRGILGSLPGSKAAGARR